MYCENKKVCEIGEKVLKASTPVVAGLGEGRGQRSLAPLFWGLWVPAFAGIAGESCPARVCVDERVIFRAVLV